MRCEKSPSPSSQPPIAGGQPSQVGSGTGARTVGAGGDSNIDVTQNVYGKSWWEERVEAVTRAVEAVSVATENAEKAEAKPDQPKSFGDQRVPLWVPQQETKIASS